MPALDLTADLVDLTRAVCDVESVSGDEAVLAGQVEAALRALDGPTPLEVLRDGDAVIARTSLGRAERVVLAGHIDTVPIAQTASGRRNLPAWVDGADVWGRGTCDMKGGVAVQLRLAAALCALAPERLTRDVTWVFYDNEEVEAERNGLGRVARTRPDLLEADFAVLLEPSGAVVEGGCNGTLRADVVVPGVAAHSARSWMGHNAIHAAGAVLTRLNAYDPEQVEVEGLVYREGLNAVGIRGGIAGNVVPDRCVVTVNYRFAPSKSLAQAFGLVQELFTGYDVVQTDGAPGARPGLDQPAARAFLDVVGEPPRPKYGWTDVSRFSALGVPAVNFGPGDPNLAHKDDERCPVAQIRRCEQVLLGWLGG